MAENKRVITTGKMGEPTPPNYFPDNDWLRVNRERLWQEYRGQDVRVVLIYNEQVVGQGKTIADAERDAEARLAPDATAITPVLFFVNGFNPLIRLTPEMRSLNGDQK